MGREPYCGLRYRYEYYLEHTFPIIPCNLPSSYKCLIESKKLKLYCLRLTYWDPFDGKLIFQIHNSVHSDGEIDWV